MPISNLRSFHTTSARHEGRFPLVSGAASRYRYSSSINACVSLVSALVAIGSVSCSSAPESPSNGPLATSLSPENASAPSSTPSGTTGTPVTCSVSLIATLVFHASQHIDGTATFTKPIPFAIPASIPITVGASKNGQASLAFSKEGGSTVTCSYTLKNAASSFSLTSCDNGDAAGASESATNFVLQIQNADHGAGTTGSEIQIGLTLRAPDGSVCAGSNACFQSYTCQSGTCTGSNPITCAALDQCHVAGSCDPSTGVCSNPAALDNTPCNDGNACHLDDTCQSGVCLPGSTIQCAASDQCHVQGTCDPATGTCSNPLAFDGTACNDGNSCDINDTCLAGVCVSGGTVQCVAQDQCHQPGVCDQSTGQCSNPVVADGTPCSDGNACHLDDTCQSGVCTAGVTFSCDTGQSCSFTPQACVPQTCATLGLNCGPAGDGCSGQLDCGQTCPANQVCGGGGTPGVCGPITSCTGLCQQQAACPGTATTTVSGTVFAPNGKDPIYNALVYVPNGPVQPFAPNVACQQCGDEVSGSPLVSTHSLADGTFTLTNVPAGTDIPIVIQLGRWRRQLSLSSVTACTDNTEPGAFFRLPANKSEGDIPLMSLVTGTVDALECVLRKIGISDSEFTAPSGTGRVQIYVGNGASVPGAPGETALYSNQTTINKYDMTILSCEGQPMAKTAAQQQVLLNYANAGGRVFATHYNYTWLYQNVSFAGTATWAPEQADPPSPLTAIVDMTNPQGASLAAWLTAVGASTTPGEISLTDARHDFNAVNAAEATRWLYWLSGTQQFPLHYTFDTPVGAPPTQQCGRVLYSDFHVDAATDSPGYAFPSECDTAPMTPQEHMLEFMIFDLSSCVSAAPPATCIPRTCAQQNISCGPAGDGCGNVLDCGSCQSPLTCGGGSVHGVCGNPYCSR